MTFDHVILATLDLEEAARQLLDEFGLASIAGGEHPGFGTGNRIVPLGSSYLELMTIADRELAQGNPLGRRVIECDGGWLGWVLTVEDVESVAERLDLAWAPMSRTLPDGSELSWRLAGLDRALIEPELPFFIQWDDPALHPGGLAAPHRVDPLSIASVEIAGDPAKIARWLGGNQLPVRIVDGEPGLRAVEIATGGETIELRPLLPA